MFENLFNILAEGHVGDNFCADTNVMKAIRVVGYLLLIAKVLIPIIIIFFGTFDIYKAVIAGETSSLKKQAKTLLIKIAVGMFIFFIPNLINWVTSSMTNYTDGNEGCITCLVEPTNCSVN